MTQRDLEVSDLLEYVLGRCAHEPAGENEVAVCDTCAAVVTLLVCRINAHRDDEEHKH